jgi:hypothetical protein
MSPAEALSAQTFVEHGAAGACYGTTAPSPDLTDLGIGGIRLPILKFIPRMLADRRLV